MSELMQVVCLSCGVINRFPANKIDDLPYCGRCKIPVFTGEPMVLNAALFARLQKHDQLPLLVDFWAPWCGPCRQMAPAFARAAEQLEPAMRLAKINTEDEPDLALRFNIRSIPTLILFSKGREMARQPGAMGLNDIIHWVQRFI